VSFSSTSSFQDGLVFYAKRVHPRVKKERKKMKNEKSTDNRKEVCVCERERERERACKVTRFFAMCNINSRNLSLNHRLCTNLVVLSSLHHPRCLFKRPNVFVSVNTDKGVLPRERFFRARSFTRIDV